MNTTFQRAPIGAKVSVNIGFGVRHVGRKYNTTQVAEFSRKRGGWNIVDVKVFAEGKQVIVSLNGIKPTQTTMLDNIRKHSKRTYSVIGFNCEAASQSLASSPPKSKQVAGGAIGAGSVGVIAHSCGANWWQTLALMACGAVVGVNVANELGD